MGLFDYFFKAGAGVTQDIQSITRTGTVAPPPSTTAPRIGTGTSAAVSVSRGTIGSRVLQTLGAARERIPTFSDVSQRISLSGERFAERQPDIARRIYEPFETTTQYIQFGRGDDVKSVRDIQEKAQRTGMITEPVIKFTQEKGADYRRFVETHGGDIERFVGSALGGAEITPGTQESWVAKQLPGTHEQWASTVGRGVVGVAKAPAGLLEFAGQVPYGLEYMWKEPKQAAAILPVAVGAMIGGTGQAFKERPWETTGEFSGMLLAGKVGGVGAGKLYTGVKAHVPYRIGLGKQRGILIEAPDVYMVKPKPEPQVPGLVKKETLPSPEAWRTYATEPKGGLGSIFFEPPAAKVGKVAGILQEQFYVKPQYVKTPYGSYTSFEITGRRPSVPKGVELIEGKVKPPTTGEAWKAYLSERIRLEKYKEVTPVEFKMSKQPIPKQIPETIWDFDMPKTPPEPVRMIGEGARQIESPGMKVLKHQLKHEERGAAWLADEQSIFAREIYQKQLQTKVALQESSIRMKQNMDTAWELAEKRRAQAEQEAIVKDIRKPTKKEMEGWTAKDKELYAGVKPDISKTVLDKMTFEERQIWAKKQKDSAWKAAEERREVAESRRPTEKEMEGWTAKDKELYAGVKPDVGYQPIKRKARRKPHEAEAFPILEGFEMKPYGTGVGEIMVPFKPEKPKPVKETSQEKLKRKRKESDEQYEGLGVDTGTGQVLIQKPETVSKAINAKLKKAQQEQQYLQEQQTKQQAAQQQQYLTDAKQRQKQATVDEQRYKAGIKHEYEMLQQRPSKTKYVPLLIPLQARRDAQKEHEKERIVFTPIQKYKPIQKPKVVPVVIPGQVPAQIPKLVPAQTTRPVQVPVPVQVPEQVIEPILKIPHVQIPVQRTQPIPPVLLIPPIPPIPPILKIEKKPKDEKRKKIGYHDPRYWPQENPVSDLWGMLGVKRK